MPDLLIAMGMFVNFSEAIIWAPDIEGIFDSSCNCSAQIFMPSCSGFFASLKRAMMSLGIMTLGLFLLTHCASSTDHKSTMPATT